MSSPSSPPPSFPHVTVARHRAYAPTVDCTEQKSFEARRSRVNLTPHQYSSACLSCSVISRGPTPNICTLLPCHFPSPFLPVPRHASRSQTCVPYIIKRMLWTHSCAHLHFLLPNVSRCSVVWALRGPKSKGNRWSSVGGLLPGAWPHGCAAYCPPMAQPD